MVNVEKVPLFEWAAIKLRALIREGTLAPGSRLQERELCARLGISNTPVREALKVLVSEGLVIHVWRRGAHVARVGDHRQDLVAVLAVLEGASAELSCERASSGEVAGFRARYDELSKTFAAKDWNGYARQSQALYEATMTAARMPVLAATHGGLLARIVANEPAKPRREPWKHSLAGYAALVAALVQRDGPRARALAEQQARWRFRAGSAIETTTVADEAPRLAAA